MRLQRLDVLRGIAIVAVLGAHMHAPPADWPALLAAPLAFWHKNGWLGVDLFFVLSGYLVSGLLFSEYKKYGRLDVRRFLIRRGFKIYPAFYLLIAVTVSVHVLALGRHIPWKKVLVESFYLQSYFPEYQLWGPTWSLSVEEHFYLFLPLVILAALRFSRDRQDPFGVLLPFGVCLAAAVLGVRSWAALHPDGTPHWDLHIIWPTHHRMDALFFGVLISYMKHFRSQTLDALLPHRRWVAWVAAFALLGPAMLCHETSVWIHTIGYTMAYLAAGIIVVLVLEMPEGSAISRWPGAAAAGSFLAWIGFYSYSIYLWHMLFRVWGERGLEFILGGAPGFAFGTAFYMAGSVLLGAALARLVETPTLALRDRWFPSRTAAKTAAPRLTPQPRPQAAPVPC